MPLGAHLGRRDPEHLARWKAALDAGRAFASRCEKIKSNSHRCGNLPLRGEKYCRMHLKRSATKEADRILELRERLDRGTGGALFLERAARSLRKSLQRLTFREWNRNPLIEWSSLHVDETTAQRIEAKLADYGFRLDTSLAHGFPPTPRCWDRLRHAARLLLRGAITEEQFRRHTTTAFRRDREFWEREAAAAME